MHQALSFLRRSFQTRSQVHDRADAAQRRAHSLRVACRVMAGVQILVQLLLWYVLWLYPQLLQSAWQGVLAQLLPALATWGLWSAIPARAPSPMALRLRLLLLPCAVVDSAALLETLSMLCQWQLPSWPSYGVALGLFLFVYLITALSGAHGAAYGVNQIRILLLLLFFGMLVPRAQPDVNRLWPLWGGGFPALLQGALGGVGGVWGVALLFALPKSAASPEGDRRSTTLAWAFLPVLLAALWALGSCLGADWQFSAGLPPKEKMILLTWQGTDLLSLQATTVAWLMLLAASLVGNAASAVTLLEEAVRLPRFLSAFLYLLPALVFAFLPEEKTLGLLELLLPYRLALSLGAGAAILLAERKRAP